MVVDEEAAIEYGVCEGGAVKRWRGAKAKRREERRLVRDRASEGDSFSTLSVKELSSSQAARIGADVGLAGLACGGDLAAAAIVARLWGDRLCASEGRLWACDAQSLWRPAEEMHVASRTAAAAEVLLRDLALL